MEFQVYRDKLSQLSIRLNFMVVISLGLMLSNICLVSLAWYTSIHQKTMVTPFSGKGGYLASDSSVDANYLLSMAENFIYLRLNTTPGSIEHQHNMILKHVDSKNFSRLREVLLRERLAIKKGNVSSVFAIKKIRSMPNDMAVVVSGTLRRWVGSRELEPAQRRYRIDFQYNLGMLLIENFSQIKEDS